MTVPNPGVQQQGTGAVSADALNSTVQACTSLAQMRGVVGVGRMMLYLEGYAAAGDGGQGPFYWNSTATGPDDGVNVIVPVGATTGAWVRLPLTVAEVLIYATLPSGATDAWSPIGYSGTVDAVVVTTDAGGSTLTGLTGGLSDRRMVLANAGPGALTVTHAGSTTPADNFCLPNSVSQTIPVNGALAFVYDANLPGWRVIGEFGAAAGSPQVFRVSMHGGPSTPYAATSILIVPYDHIDYDTTGGFSLTQAVPFLGNIPAFKIPTAGYWTFQSTTQFFDASSNDTIQILKSINHYDSAGNDVEFAQTNSPLMTITANPSSQTFSVSASVQSFCDVGDFISVNDDLESAGTSATLSLNTGSNTLIVTYFSGQFIGPG